MSKKAHLFFTLILMLIIGVGVTSLYNRGWIKVQGNSPETFEVGESRTTAMQMTGYRYQVVENNEANGLVIRNLHNAAEMKFRPCTEEQKNLNVGDTKTLIYSFEQLGTVPDKIDSPSCHLKILQKSSDNQSKN